MLITFEKDKGMLSTLVVGMEEDHFCLTNIFTSNFDNIHLHSLCSLIKQPVERDTLFCLCRLFPLFIDQAFNYWQEMCLPSFSTSGSLSMFGTTSGPVIVQENQLWVNINHIKCITEL